MIYKFVALAALLAANTIAEFAPNRRHGYESDVVKDDYVVRFHADAVDEFHAVVNRRTSMFANPIHVNDFGSYHGFHGKLSKEELDVIQETAGVASIEPNAKVYTLQQNPQVSPGSWGIDRVDQRDLPLDEQYGWDDEGANANVFVLDTGILTSHPDFDGRIVFEADCHDDTKPCDTSVDTADENGHGTHCAGTIGSSTLGVAKKATIYNVRCMDGAGSGTWAGIINAIEHVVEWDSRPGARIISMSLGGGFMAAANAAIDAATAEGVLSVVAAGNAMNNACTLSPASAETAFTVSSTDPGDQPSFFSSWGPCVDIFAPGGGINSTYNNGGYATLSGTSMATPHVAGAAAIVASREGLTDPQAIADVIIAAATPDVVRGVPANTPNLLLYTLRA